LKKLRFLLLLLLTVLVGSIAFVFGFVKAVESELPALDPANATPTEEIGFIYDRNGRQIARLRGDEARVIVQSRDIAPVMKQAVVAVEDRRFWEHKGVDIRGMARAAWADIRNRDILQGGSTITQQLIKNTALSPDPTVSRKLKEATLAWQLEQQWGKEKILTAYLNTIFFGNNAYGVEVASRIYFSKHSNELTLPEAALLAGIPVNPTRYDPVRRPKDSKTRRNTVLRLMLEQGLITREEFLEARETPMPDPQSVKLPRARGLAGYFVEYVKQELLIPRFGDRVVLNGGLHVHTSIDLDIQHIAKNAITEHLPDPDGIQAALVVIDPRTGEVLAMVGGRSFSKSQFNLAVQGQRQPGSAFKPFVLAAAFEQGISDRMTYESKPVVIPANGEFWAVNNYRGFYLGKGIDLRTATVSSDNAVYAQLTAHAGPKNVASVANRLGIKSKLNGFFAIGLGAEAVNPLEMARAYATFANGGVRIDGRFFGDEPRAIIAVERAGEWETNDIQRKRAIPRNDAVAITSMLTNVVRAGTGKRARLEGRELAGKTGTTENHGDAWFVGYTPQLSVAVWVGWPDSNKPMLDEFDGDPVAGGTFPALIAKTFLEEALDHLKAPPRPFGTVEPLAADLRKVVRRDGEWMLDNGLCKNTRRILFTSTRGPGGVADCRRNEVTVPDTIGRRLAAAETLLVKASLFPEIISRPAEPGERLGVVVDQFPKEGRLSSFETVQLVVAEAQEGVVPNVVGTRLEVAEERLVKRKLQTIVSETDEGEAGVVVSQTPLGRVAASPGMVVELTVGRINPDATKRPDS
jgi:penicillin-binding protein 1A